MFLTHSWDCQWTVSVEVPEDGEMRCGFISLGGQGRISLTIYICL